MEKSSLGVQALHPLCQNMIAENSQDTLIVLGQQQDLLQFARYYRLSRAVSTIKNKSIKNG